MPFPKIYLFLFEVTLIMGYSRKNPNGWGLRICFFEKPLEKNFFSLPLEIPDRTKLSPWIFHKIVLDPSEIPRPKTKIPGNSTLFFLGHTWKFHFVFNEPLEIPHAISLITLEIAYPQPTVWNFSGIAQ